jgi:hypothetical protein
MYSFPTDYSLKTSASVVSLLIMNVIFPFSPICWRFSSAIKVSWSSLWPLCHFLHYLSLHKYLAWSELASLDAVNVSAVLIAWLNSCYEVKPSGFYLDTYCLHSHWFPFLMSIDLFLCQYFTTVSRSKYSPLLHLLPDDSASLSVSYVFVSPSSVIFYATEKNYRC